MLLSQIACTISIIISSVKSLLITSRSRWLPASGAMVKEVAELTLFRVLKPSFDTASILVDGSESRTGQSYCSVSDQIMLKVLPHFALCVHSQLILVSKSIISSEFLVTC